MSAFHYFEAPYLYSLSRRLFAAAGTPDEIAAASEESSAGLDFRIMA